MIGRGMFEDTTAVSTSVADTASSRWEDYLARYINAATRQAAATS